MAKIYKNLFGDGSKIGINEIYPLPFSLRKQNSRVEDLDLVTDDSLVLFNGTTLNAPFEDWGFCLTIRMNSDRWFQIAIRQGSQQTAVRTRWDSTAGYRGWTNL